MYVLIIYKEKNILCSVTEVYNITDMLLKYRIFC